MPKVSVVIPCYNHEHYVGTAISSVLAQTNGDYEIIVVDDGSQDNSAAIIAQFGKAVWYIWQKNSGLSAARNTGIRNAQGEIIALLDSDDMWEPEFLARMTTMLENSPKAVAAYCGFRYIDQTGQVVGEANVKVVAPTSFYQVLVCEGNWLVPCAVVFRKQAALDVGLFDETLRAVEDADLWMRLCEKGQFEGVAEALTRYRRHDSNMTRDPERMISASLKQTEKLFGLDDGVSASWTAIKKGAYIQFYRSALARYLQAGKIETGAYFFRKLYNIAPELALSIGIWRSVARQHIPQEYQGEDSHQFNWSRAQQDVAALLNELEKNHVEQGEVSPRCNRHEYSAIEGSAYLALADEAGRTQGIRQMIHWLWRAFISYPRIAISRAYLGTIVRSFTNQ